MRSPMADGDLQAGIRLLGTRDVGRLFAAYVITFTGTAMAPIAMAFGVLEMTGSTADSSFVIAAPTAAAVAMLLFGGVLADRTSRKGVMVFAETLAMCVQLAIATLFLTGQATVPLLAGLMLLLGVSMALNAPAASGLVVQLVPRDELQPANALLSTARHGALAGGFALGGVLTSTVGAGVTLLIDALSFGVSAALVLSLRPRPQVPGGRESVIRELALGFREFVSHTWLWVIVLQFSLLVAVHESTFGLIGPAVAKEFLGGARDWGLIAGSFGAGTIAGGVVSFSVKPRHPMRVATLLTFAFSVLPFGLSVPLPLIALCGLAFGTGVAGQIFAVLWYTTLQRKVPEGMLSRVSAYDHLGSIALAPLGIVVAGFAYEALGHRATLLLGGSLVITVCVCAYAVRDVRTMTAD